MKVPGLVLVWTPAGATCQPLSLPEGGLVIGRNGFGDTQLHDPRISRQHCRVRQVGDGWRVEDLGSRNGTVVDGREVRGAVERRGACILRVGRCLFLLVDDISRYRSGVARHDGVIAGPALRAAWKTIADASTLGNTLLITGESGVGKELAAQRFHDAPPRREGPLIVVNCAAIPETLAESLLFGSRRGAFSGATDAPGYVLSAHRGTLFLDEAAELSLPIQGKLLRVLETRQVLPLGAAAPRPVDFRLCLATNRNLRAAVVRGSVREDFYFRTCRPTVKIPPLRERLEELPWLIEAKLAALAEPRVAHVSLVESCMMRIWSGNVRELTVELRSAALRAEPGAPVSAADLDPDAGRLLSVTRVASAARPLEAVDSRPARAEALSQRARDARQSRSHAFRNRERIVGALREGGGNVTHAARQLGVSRTQLRRWIAKLELEPRRFR